MPLLVPVIRITDIRAPFASREAAKRLLGGAAGGEEALDPELVPRDVVGCSEEAQVTGRDLGLHGQVELAPPSRPPIYADAVRPTTRRMPPCFGSPSPEPSQRISAGPRGASLRRI